MGKKKKKETEDSPDFEASLQKAEAIVDELEEGELTLTNSIKRFEEGQKILKQCYELLEKAEKKVESLGVKPADDEDDH